MSQTSIERNVDVNRSGRGTGVADATTSMRQVSNAGRIPPSTRTVTEWTPTSEGPGAIKSRAVCGVALAFSGVSEAKGGESTSEKLNVAAGTWVAITTCSDALPATTVMS